MAQKTMLGEHSRKFLAALFPAHGEGNPKEALVYFEKAVDSGESIPGDIYDVVVPYYVYGNYVEQNHLKAMELALKGARAGGTTSLQFATIFCLQSQNKEIQKEGARFAKELYEINKDEGALYLGKTFLLELGNYRDDYRALDLFKESALYGNSEACVLIGLLLSGEFPSRITEDLPEAYAWLSVAKSSNDFSENEIIRYRNKVKDQLSPALYEISYKRIKEIEEKIMANFERVKKNYADQIKFFGDYTEDEKKNLIKTFYPHWLDVKE